jgi:hypothetical protein
MRPQMPEAAVTLATQAGAVPLERLVACVQGLDAPTRALLDLSVRRGVRDDQMAPILRTDPFHLAWRRARALEKVASEMGDRGRPAPLGDVRMALEALPLEAWGVPGIGPLGLPAPGPARGAALVPSVPAPAGRLQRLDAFAAGSPTLRAALAGLGRAMAAKAVRVVAWPRRGGR